MTISSGSRPSGAGRQATFPWTTSTGRKVIRIDVFISSPSDVAEEREIVRRVVERLNRGPLRDYFFIVALLYEEDVPPQVGKDAQVIVDRYMHVVQSQVMVCMLWSRMGTPFTITETGDCFDSGTQYEFVKAYEAFVRNGHPNILLYRRTEDNAEADPVQKSLVRAFFDQFHGPQPRWKGLWAEYNDLRVFEDRLRDDLERIIRAMRVDEERARVDQPEFSEETRRLDAAMPRKLRIGEPTELRAMICLPDSDGLAALLPHQSEDDREISHKDVREGNLMIAFPKDRGSGELRPTPVSIQIEAPDFEIREPCQTVLLSPGRDSAVAILSLTAVRARERSTVIVRVKARALGGGEYLCGSTVLYTSVKATRLWRIGRKLWSVASLSLGAPSGLGDLKARLEHMRKNAASSGSSPSAGAGGGSRAARWSVQFDNNAETMLAQVGWLSGEVLCPGPDNRWWSATDLHTEAPRMCLVDLSPDNRIYLTVDNPNVLAAIACRFGLVAPPIVAAVLLPTSLVQRLTILEREYENVEEDRITATVFRVLSASVRSVASRQRGGSEVTDRRGGGYGVALQGAVLPVRADW